MSTKYFILVSSALLLNACGDGSSDSSDSINMDPNQTYTVSSGDRLIKNAADTIVKITHTDGSKTSTVELVAGEATIIRK